MAKIVIYTCIIGKYDTPCDDFEKREGYDYKLYSDIAINTNSWNSYIIKLANSDELGETKCQRYIKTHPFEFLDDYDVVVYIDANTRIDDKLYRYIETNMENPITFKVHPKRKCIYEELKECCIRMKEDQKMCNFLYSRYENERYPAKNGLFENNIIISHPKDPNVQEIFRRWWDEINMYSKRDQLSLNYVLWKYDLKKYVHAAATKDFPPRKHHPLGSLVIEDKESDKKPKQNSEKKVAEFFGKKLKYSIKNN